jgi:hypothetical protein
MDQMSATAITSGQGGQGVAVGASFNAAPPKGAWKKGRRRDAKEPGQLEDLPLGK